MGRCDRTVDVLVAVADHDQHAIDGRMAQEDAERSRQNWRAAHRPVLLGHISGTGAHAATGGNNEGSSVQCGSHHEHLIGNR